MADADKPWTVQEMADYLGVNKDFVYDQCASHIWQHSRVGRKIRFFPADRLAVEETLRRPAAEARSVLALAGRPPRRRRSAA